MVRSDMARAGYSLSLAVESDYTVVFFAAGSRHAPSWNWVWKAYRSLSRKYRKNLKSLVSLPLVCFHLTLIVCAVYRTLVFLFQECVLPRSLCTISLTSFSVVLLGWCHHKVCLLPSKTPFSESFTAPSSFAK